MDHDPRLTALGALGGFFVLRTGVPPHRTLPTLARAYAPRQTDGPDRTGQPGPTPPTGPEPPPTARPSARPTTTRPPTTEPPWPPSPAPDPPPDPPSDPLTTRIRRVAAGTGAREARVAASVAHQALAARLWSVALGAAALYERGPDLDPGLLRWDPEGSAPDDLWLTGFRPVPADALADTVCDGHLVPLHAALRARLSLPEGLLWGNAASALLGAVGQTGRWALPDRPDAARRARALAGRVLARPEFSGTVDPTGRRRSCCLYYRVPGGGVCGDCCFVRPPGR